MEWSLLRDVLVSLDINCVLDVGASRGQFARNLRKIRYKGYIISFEPVRRDYSLLSHGLRDDRYWCGYNLALGSENTSALLHVAEQCREMSSLLAPLDPTWQMETEQVDVRRLDSVFAEATGAIENPRVFLKMDTQGFDLEVVKGAAGCIGQIVGIQSEVSVQPMYEGMPHFTESLNYYEGLGFKLVGVSEIARDEETGHLVELNVVLSRNSVQVHD